jgi:hypothetical protein
MNYFLLKIYKQKILNLRTKIKKLIFHLNMIIMKVTKKKMIKIQEHTYLEHNHQRLINLKHIVLILISIF